MSVIVAFIVEMTNGIFRSQSRVLLVESGAPVEQSSCQPRTQALFSLSRKTLVGSGHVATTFWVITNNIKVPVRLF